MDQPTVFFVDDEKNVLDGLRRVLRRKVRNWKTYYLNSGAEALEKMKEVKCDVIVSDMRMPGMDGAQLLKEVTEQYPDTVRFILSGQSDNDAIDRSVAYTHQFLAKPCEVKLLIDLITAALDQRDILNNKNLRPLVTKINSLPSLPSIYQELRECVENESPISEVVRLISQDVAMTAKVMQLVNSSFFGLSNHISSISQAVGLLGLNTICSLVLSATVFRPFEDLDGVDEKMLKEFSDHSLLTAQIAQKIMRRETKDQNLASEAYVAGLLHDIGKTVLLTQLPEEYAQIQKLAADGGISFDEAEQKVYGATHADLGAYLLGMWGLPLRLINAVKCHHDKTPYEGGTPELSQVVRGADAILYSQEPFCEWATSEEERKMECEGIPEDVLARWKKWGDEILEMNKETESIESLAKVN